MSLTSSDVIQNIKVLTAKLIELSLCNEQNFPTSSTLGTATEISFSGREHLSSALRNVPYCDLYEALVIGRAFNFKMVDGGLVQLSYRFNGIQLTSHRLAFFPSPHLEEYQNNPEIYETEEVYAEIVLKNVVPFPIRFDFDVSDKSYKDLHHPRSHMTLGQYVNCRIPVKAPLSPSAFMDFILRSFYNTAHRKYCEELPRLGGSFDDTISELEQSVLHIRTP